MTLPAYRRVSLRIFATAEVARSGELAAALHDALVRFGEVRVAENGPYWKIATELEFTVDIAPAGSAEECFAVVQELATGWADDVWNRRDGVTFLHPAVSWASITSAQADALPPPDREGEIVVVRDCPVARDDGHVGAVGMVEGLALDVAWRYVVRPRGSERILLLSEDELDFTGRLAQDTAWLTQ